MPVVDRFEPFYKVNDFNNKEIVESPEDNLDDTAKGLRNRKNKNPLF